MKIEAVKSFAGPYGAFAPSDVRDVPDAVGQEWLRIGYARRVGAAIETATMPPCETTSAGSPAHVHRKAPGKRNR